MRPAMIVLESESKNEAESLELAMRAILRMFADGNLVYRRREASYPIDVSRPASRIRAIRGGAA